MSYYNNNPVDGSVVIAGCCRNVAKFLPNVFQNINRIKSCFDPDFYKIIFSYDDSDDDTLKLINEYKIKDPNVYLILNPDDLSPIRTVNIAKARNGYMNLIRKKFKDYDYMIVLDMDDVSAYAPINIGLIKEYFKRANDWDCLTFNRPAYYDIWALRYGPNNYLNQWAWFENSSKVVDYFSKDVKEKLDKLKFDEYLQVESAFNGIAFYKLKKFINCSYNGRYNIKLLSTYNIMPNLKLFPDYRFSTNYAYECEHVNMHYEAKYKYDLNLKILISPLNIFIETNKPKNI
jgi:hypothetical protein